MVDSYDVVDLADWVRGESEPGGDEAKRWFIAAESSRYAGHWLFKPRRIKTLVLSKERRRRGDEPDVLVRGEDWAEKISYEVAKLLAIPAAETELATVIQLRSHERVFGSMSRDMRPRTWAWTPGAALLAERDDDFDAKSCRGHTIGAVRAALEGLFGPVGTDYAGWAAFDVFAGYLLLDAWIANTDRHAHNWGVLQNSRTGDLCLGPSLITGQRSPAVMATTSVFSGSIRLRSIFGASMAARNASMGAKRLVTVKATPSNSSRYPVSSGPPARCATRLGTRTVPDRPDRPGHLHPGHRPRLRELGSPALTPTHFEGSARRGGPAGASSDLPPSWQPLSSLRLWLPAAPVVRVLWRKSVLTRLFPLAARPRFSNDPPSARGTVGDLSGPDLFTDELIRLSDFTGKVVVRS